MAVFAAQARAYNGVLTVGFTGTPGGAADAACTGHVQWPQVDDIEILGVGDVNVSSVVVTVCPRPSHLGMAMFPYREKMRCVHAEGRVGNNHTP